MSHSEDKYNAIMPQTTERVICVQIDKPISKEGYQDNFLPLLHKMIEEQGEIRSVIYYKKFHGWEENAAQLDLQTAVEHGAKFKKVALVNTPEKEEFNVKFKKGLVSGELKFFEENELEEAIKWASE